MLFFSTGALAPGVTIQLANYFMWAVDAGFKDMSLFVAIKMFGTIIALVVGWMNADRWGIRTLMIVYTILIILALIFGTVAPTPEVVEYRQRFVQ